MIEPATRKVRRLLGPLDPALQHRTMTDAESDAVLHRILATKSETATSEARAQRDLRPRRSLYMTAGVAATAVVAAVAITVAGGIGTPSPAFAATPAPLNYSAVVPLDEHPQVRLEALAGHVAQLPPEDDAGRYQHIKTQSWSLFTRIDGKQVTSEVVPAQRETWRTAEDEGKAKTAYLKDGQESDSHTELYPQGSFPAMWKDAAPGDAAQLSTWLKAGHPSENGPAETLVAIADLVKEQTLNAHQRAAVLRVLATVPGLKDYGVVVDRVGQSGRAYAVDSSYSGLPTRYTIVVSEATGAVQDFEQMLTKTAGELNVPIPSVIGYTSIQVSNRVNVL